MYIDNPDGYSHVSKGNFYKYEKAQAIELTAAFIDNEMGGLVANAYHDIYTATRKDVIWGSEQIGIYYYDEDKNLKAIYYVEMDVCLYFKDGNDVYDIRSGNDISWQNFLDSNDRYPWYEIENDPLMWKVKFINNIFRIFEIETGQNRNRGLIIN